MFEQLQNIIVYFYWSNLPGWNAIAGDAAAFAVIALFTATGAMIRASVIRHRCTVLMMVMMMCGRRAMTTAVGRCRMMIARRNERIQFRICIPGFKLKSLV